MQHYRAILWRAFSGIDEDDSLPRERTTSDSSSYSPQRHSESSTEAPATSPLSLAREPAKDAETVPLAMQRTESAVGKFHKERVGKHLAWDVGDVEEYYVKLTKNELWQKLYNKSGDQYQPLLKFEATHKFESGAMGITYSDEGIVEVISPDGQACTKGISKGDKILKVDKENYSKDAVGKAEKSGAPYEVTFKVSVPTQADFETMKENGLEDLNENSRIFGLTPNSHHYIRLGRFVNDQKIIDSESVVFLKSDILERVQRRHYRVNGTLDSLSEFPNKTVIAATTRRGSTGYAMMVHGVQELGEVDIAKDGETNEVTDEGWQKKNMMKEVTKEDYDRLHKLCVPMRNEDCGINFNFEKANNIMIYQLPVDLYRGTVGKTYLPEGMAHELKKLKRIPRGFRLWLEDGCIEVPDAWHHLRSCCPRRQQDPDQHSDSRPPYDLYVTVHSQKEFISTTVYFLIGAGAKVICEFYSIAVVLTVRYNNWPAYAFLYQGLLGLACSAIASIRMADSQLREGVLKDELQLSRGSRTTKGLFRLKVALLIYLWAPQLWTQTLMQVHPWALPGQGRFAGKFNKVRIFGITWFRESHYKCENYAGYLSLFPHTILKEMVGLVFAREILRRQRDTIIVVAFSFKLVLFVIRILCVCDLVRVKFQLHHWATQAWNDLWPSERKPAFCEIEDANKCLEQWEEACILRGWTECQMNLARMLRKIFPRAPGGNIERWRFYHSFFLSVSKTYASACAKWLIRLLSLIQILLLVYPLLFGEPFSPIKKPADEASYKAEFQSCVVQMLEQAAMNNTNFGVDFRAFLHGEDTRDILTECLSDR